MIDHTRAVASIEGAYISTLLTVVDPVQVLRDEQWAEDSGCPSAFLGLLAKEIRNHAAPELLPVFASEDEKRRARAAALRAAAAASAEPSGIQRVLSILRAADGFPLTVDQVQEQLNAQGWHSESADERNTVNSMLGRAVTTFDDVERVARGHYRAIPLTEQPAASPAASEQLPVDQDLLADEEGDAVGVGSSSRADGARMQ